MTTARIPMRFGPSDVDVIHGADGSQIVRSSHELPDYPRAMTDRLDHWATVAPDRVFLAQRDTTGAWQTITFADAQRRARNIAQAVIDRDLNVDRPIVILSGNSLDHALLGLGAMYAGVPYASISTAYSLIASDFAKLRSIFDLLTPGLVFAENGTQYARAIEGVVPADAEIVVSRNSPDGRPATLFASLCDTPAGPVVDAAHGKVGPDTIAKFLFTSGSTGAPKGVINTQRMLTSNQAMLAITLPTFASTPPVLVEWLPWSHTFGANHNLGIAMMHGGTFYIDDGKPVPKVIEETVRNLREIAPTAYFNVPKGYELLLPYLQAEPALARTFFSRLQFMFYAGAVLPQHVAAEYERLAIEVTGERIRMITSLGSTETAPAAIGMSDKASKLGVVGIPLAGVELKLVPNAGKLEARLKGPNITPGYWRQQELTEQAFDADGYYLLGDALRLADPGDPEKGLIFDGRVSEDFKLKTGTWVSVGPLRGKFVATFAPFARDVVIAGHDRDEVSALVIPDLEACRALAADLEGQPVAAVLGHAAVRSRFSTMLADFNKNAGGSSNRIARLILLEASPSLDTGEMTDKGSINQRAVLANRMSLVEELYASPRPPRVIS